MTDDANQADATSLLVAAADTIAERGRQRDQPSGERSMARTIAAFNAIYGTNLTETQGWQFMALLKITRSSASDSELRIDDYVDQSAYAALAGECATRMRQQRLMVDRYSAAADASIAHVHDLLRRRHADHQRPDDKL